MGAESQSARRRLPLLVNSPLHAGTAMLIHIAGTFLTGTAPLVQEACGGGVGGVRGRRTGPAAVADKIVGIRMDHVGPRHSFSGLGIGCGAPFGSRSSRVSAWALSLPHGESMRVLSRHEDGLGRDSDLPRARNPLILLKLSFDEAALVIMDVQRTS